MRKINTALIEQKVYETALKACVNITPACKEALLKARDVETGEAAKFALQTLINNSETAVKEHMPVCQDTGMAVDRKSVV